MAKNPLLESDGASTGFGKSALHLAHPRASHPRDIEKLLAQSEERLSLVLSIRTLGLWQWDRATDEVWASRQARIILGLDEHAPLTRDSLLAAIHPSDRPGIVKAIRSTVGDQDTVEMELRVVRPPHGVGWITSKVCAYRDTKGMLLRATGCVIDDSQRKTAEAESLKQQEEITHLRRVATLGELSGALAHELQQPLTAILCNAQAAQLLAAKDGAKTGDLLEMLEDIVSEDKRAGHIIQHLRSLLTRGELHVQPLQMDTVVHDALKLAHGALKARNVQVDLCVEQGVPAVLADRIEIQQVILNLLLNACEALSERAVGDRRIGITIARDSAPGMIRTSVRDCGVGIDRDRLDHVFDAFFTTKKTGLGLGLAVCHSIIVAHKGRLWAANNLDRGAVFHFTLPLSPGHQ